MLELSLIAQATFFIELLTDWIWPLFLIFFGFGMIIFVHELGHFLMAKFMDIRIDVFALGFGPRVVGIKIGQTDYCIRAFPLGGYIKMLGQGDVGVDKSDYQGPPDPQSFLAKSIAQRMWVVSAGVIMNLVFAALTFMIVFTHGMEFRTAEAGFVVPGTPADLAGIQAGDKFVSIGGQSISHFGEMQMAVALSKPDQPLEVVVQRSGKQIRMEMAPKLNKQEGLRQIGVSVPFGLTVWLPGYATGQQAGKAGKLFEGDRILAIDGQDVSNFDQVRRSFEAARGKYVKLKVQRQVDDKVEILELSRRAFISIQPTFSPKRQTAREVLGSQSILGMIPRRRLLDLSVPEEESNPQRPHPGDIVYKIGNVVNPTGLEIFDFLLANKDSSAQITVLRPYGQQDISIDIPSNFSEQSYPLDFAVFDDEYLLVTGTVPDSPASEMKLPRGAVITAIDGQQVNNWVDLVDACLALAGKRITVSYTYQQTEQTAAMLVPEDKAWIEVIHYSMDFLTKPKMTLVKAANPYEAITLGVGQTWYWIKAVYVTIRAIAVDRVVSPTVVSGPVRILDRGRLIAKESFNKLLYFLALISANLAVINFLPIPIVDGGLMLVLLVEGIRGRPLSLKVMAIWQGAGLALIAAVFLFVTYQDIIKIIRGE